MHHVREVHCTVKRKSNVENFKKETEGHKKERKV
jgi:hypothetical protein